MGKQKRKWPAQKRLEIVLEGIRTGEVAKTCRRHGCSSAQYYDWQRQLMSSAEVVFDKKRGRPSQKEERMQAELDRKDRIIAEVIAENLDLKKTLGD
jgi:transposase-like protein